MSGIPCKHSKLSQSALMSHLQQGDLNAFEFIVCEYGGYLRNVALRYLVNVADAEDAVQETYVQALKNIGHFRGDSSLKSWLHRITVNNALMMIRKTSRIADIEVNDNQEVFDENGKRRKNENSIDISLEKIHENDEFRQTIQQLILSLPAAYRNIMLLRDIENYSIAETADKLQISQSAVKTGLHLSLIHI